MKTWKAVLSMVFLQYQDVCSIALIVQRFNQSGWLGRLICELNKRILFRMTPSKQGLLLTLVSFSIFVREGCWWKKDKPHFCSHSDLVSTSDLCCNFYFVTFKLSCSNDFPFFGKITKIEVCVELKLKTT